MNFAMFIPYGLERDRHGNLLQMDESIIPKFKYMSERNQGHVEIRHTVSKEPYVVNKAENGETLSTSESFSTGRSTALKNIAAHVQLFEGKKTFVKEYDANDNLIDEFYIDGNAGIWREGEGGYTPIGS